MKLIKKIVFLTCTTVSSILFGMDHLFIATKKNKPKPVFDEGCLQKLLMLPDTTKQKIIADIENNKEWWYFDGIFAEGANIKFFCYNLLGTQVAMATHGHVHVFDINTKKEIASCEYHDGDISSLYYHPSGKKILISSFQGKVSNFSIKKGKITSSYRYHKKLTPLTSLCCHPSKKRIATGSGDKRARIFRTKKKKAIVSFLHEGRINSVDYHPSGNELLTGANDGAIHIFDIQNRIESASFHQPQHTSVCYTPSGNHIVIGLLNGRVLIIDRYTRKQIASMICDTQNLSICCHPSGKHVAALGLDGKVCIFRHYDQSTLEQLVLKKMLIAWLLIEKPDKEINTSERLLLDIARKHTVDHNDISRIWMSLSEHLRFDLWYTIWYNIKKYGKRKKQNDHFASAKQGSSDILQTYRKQRVKRSFS